jgi:glutamate synthase domain-containing protein 1
LTRERERDACGIGFIADVSGRSSREIVDLALEALCRVRHRGAVAADALTGDGAGVLLPLSPAFLDPSRRSPGAAMVFLDPSDPARGRAIVEEACRAEGIEVTGWRAVPVDPAALGSDARRTAPRIEQALLGPFEAPGEEAERACFRARRRIERAERERGIRLYVSSISYRTITYKGLCAADQLSSFYGDLADPRFEAWFALFHQRYSTNTTPTWERAQPFRFLGHNGEINTIRGNVALMQGRRARLGADWIDENLLDPVVHDEGSDSGILDEALELLVRGGRKVEHAAAMLMPPAYEDDRRLDRETVDLFRYHRCLLEPWDGPAALVYADGQKVGAGLDRNGLRPLRVSVTEDGLVACASEAGAVPLAGHGRVRRTKIGPGCALIVSPQDGGLLENQELKRSLARRAPYGTWLEENLEPLAPGRPVQSSGEDPAARQVAAGWSKEELTVVVRPMAVEGAEPTSSMGDDTAQPPLADYPRVVFNFLKQRFAQVTNPPIDHLRERHVMSITTLLGPRATLLQETPEAARLIESPTFLLYPSAVRDLEERGAVALDATFPIEDGPDGLEEACRRLASDAEKSVRDGAPFLVVSDRAVSAERAPVPSALAAGAVHHRLLHAGLRSQTSLIVEADDVRETHHVACLLTNGADAVCPRLALESVAHLAGRGR